MLKLKLVQGFPTVALLLLAIREVMLHFYLGSSSRGSHLLHLLGLFIAAQVPQRMASVECSYFTPCNYTFAVNQDSAAQATYELSADLVKSRSGSTGASGRDLHPSAGREEIFDNSWRSFPSLNLISSIY